MIVTTDIENILYVDCKVFGIATYQSGNIPTGEVTTERIVIIADKLVPKKYWEECFVNVNFLVPDKNGYAQKIRLQQLQRLAKNTLDDHFGKFDGTGYTYEICLNGIEENADLKCHYVNVKLLFKILNVKL